MGRKDKLDRDDKLSMYTKEDAQADNFYKNYNSSPNETNTIYKDRLIQNSNL